MTIWAVIKTGTRKFPKVQAERQPRLAIWYLKFGSFLIPCCHLFTSLLLNIREMQLEYILNTDLSKPFPVLSPLPFNSLCLYSAYALLIVLSLVLSTFSHVHCCSSHLVNIHYPCLFQSLNVLLSYVTQRRLPVVYQRYLRII